MTANDYAALVDSHATALMLFARQWCATPEDVVQDAFCKLAGLRVWPDEPVSWLFRVVRNRAIDVGKSERRRQQREFAASQSQLWFEEREIDGLDCEVAVAALHSLPEEQREIIVARLWGGMNLEQISTIVGCSVSTAHRRYEAGITALREKLRVTCPTNKTP